MYEGKLARLRRVETEDVSVIMSNWNNYELRQYLASPLPNTRDEMVKTIERWNDAFTKRTEFVFGIESLDDDVLIGLINLESVSWISRNASLGFFAIFDPEYLGKGYGADAMTVLLDVAFSHLDLHSVYLWVEAFNERAIRLYKKIGFSERGTLRELTYRKGKRCDVVVMDILKAEFTEWHDQSRG